MPDKSDVEMPDDVKTTLLDAIRERIAVVNVVSVLADDTNCYSKGPVGDNYAKNKCSIDFGGWRVLPAGMKESLSGRQES
jgi:hypothetical protein